MGNVDEQVSSGGFTITAKFGVTEHYSGDVCSSKVIKLPMGVGTISWEGLKCPVAKGEVSVAVDVQLSKFIPAKLAKGTIQIQAAGASKENLICLEMDTSAATQELPQLAVAPVVQPNFGLAPFQEPMVEGGNLNLKWTDCGDSSYHAKVKALSPTVLPIGQKTTITGSGNVDEQVTGGAFTITAKFGVTEHYSDDVCSSKVIKLPLGVGTITWEGLKCPVAKGDVSVAVDVSLSRLIPAKLAKGTIEIQAAGASKENLICLDIDTSAATQDLPQLAVAPLMQPKLDLAPFQKPSQAQCLGRGATCSAGPGNGGCCEPNL